MARDPRGTEWFRLVWTMFVLAFMVPMYLTLDYARDHGWDRGWGIVGLTALVVVWMAALMALAGAPFWIRWPMPKRR